MDKEKLIACALDCLKNSYAPYSHYNVAAAVLASSGKIYTGVNVENSSYGLTICAERNAIFHAIAEGETKIEAIALVGDKDAVGKGIVDDFSLPCGACRQVMREFADPKKFLIVSAKSNGESRTWTLEELLPESFGPENLEICE